MKIQKSKVKINHPEYYGGDTTYEAIKVIEAWGSDFHVGSALKYLCRAGKKSPDALSDLRKARWYVERKIQNLERAAKRRGRHVHKGGRHDGKVSRRA